MPRNVLTAPAVILALGVLASAAALGVLAPAASASLTIEGRGWGHGIGMSQYGAHGFALREGRSAEWILRHYYPGTRIGRADPVRVRVLLKRSGSHLLCGATRASDPRGRTVRLSSSRRYRVRPAGAVSVRLVDTATDRIRATLRAPVRVTGGTSVCLRGRAQNGTSNGRYRGALSVEREGGALNVINSVHVRHYLYGVVPAEMPSSWPLEALKAQAIVARSYAMRGLRPARRFDLYADVRSQVYRGMRAETPAGNRAVRETGAWVVRHGDEIAQTFYFSTSGGHTAANEEVWGGSPVAYLRAVPDPHDDLSPVHAWRATVTRARAEERLGDLVSGRLEGMRVVARGPSGRALRVELRGSRGTRTVPAAEIRRLLELRSTWFTVRAG